MIIGFDEAKKIAEEAMEKAGFSITLYAGYYPVYQNDTNPDDDTAVAISKAAENGHEYFDIYVSDSDDDRSYWDATETLNTDELARKLCHIAQNADIQRI